MPEIWLKYHTIFQTDRIYQIQGRMGSVKVMKVSEAYTSQTCFNCHKRHKKARKTQGLFNHARIVVLTNADYNGAMNILQRKVGVL